VKKQAVKGLDWLHDRMEQLGFDTLEDAARACDLNRGNLYRYFSFETRPSIDVLPKLCEGLDASPLEVLQALGIQSTKR
jgi:transcriptional regulator with XRE-family HTH domain